MDTVANCIVYCFNQKDNTIYAYYEQVLMKGNLGVLVLKNSDQCVSSTQSLTLILYEFSYLYWQNSITVSGKVEEVTHCIMSLISTKEKKKDLVPHQPGVMPLVKIILIMPETNASSE